MEDPALQLMLVKLIKLAGISACVGGYYASQQTISLENPYLHKTFELVAHHYPEHSQNLFKALLKLNLIKKEERLGRYILSSGFDRDGKYLQQLFTIGFKGVEVGPTSYNPSHPDDPEIEMGINKAIASIYSFKENESRKFEIQLKVAPNYEVLKFTPYLIKENLIEALRNYSDIQKLTTITIAKNINVCINRQNMKLANETSPQSLQMLRQLKSEGKILIDELNSTLKEPISLNFQQRKIEYLPWPRLLNFLQGKQQIL